MGNNNTIKQHQQVVNDVVQASRQDCLVSCQNKINDATIIVIGGTGNVNISQECKMSGINCILKSSFNTQIESILKSMIDQDASISGLFNFSDVTQNVDIYQYLENSITQTMEKSCKFQDENDASGIYMYVQDRKGDVNLSQSASITNATCNMNSIAKAVTYNEESSKTKQTQEVTGIFAMMMTVIIVGIVMLGLVAIVFFISGGVKTVGTAIASRNQNTSSSSKSSSNSSLISRLLPEAEEAVEADPELLALA